MNPRITVLETGRLSNYLYSPIWLPLEDSNLYQMIRSHPCYPLHQGEMIIIDFLVEKYPHSAHLCRYTIYKKHIICFTLERITGIEPVPFVWQTNILPLNYIRILASRTGLEPVISAVTVRCVNHSTNGPWSTRWDLNP